MGRDESSRTRVGWLVNVAWSPGRDLASDARRTVAVLEAWGGPRPVATLIVADSRDKRCSVPPDVVAAMARSVQATVEVANASSAFGVSLLEQAFGESNCRSAETMFKNTVAYLWGLRRLHDLGADFVVHIDDDIDLIPPAPGPSDRLEVLRLDDWTAVSVSRAATNGWVETSLEALVADATLLSVHPLPLGPAPLGAHPSRMHDAATNCTRIADECACDRPPRSDVVGNAFGLPRAAGPRYCGHTVGGYRRGAPHFSFQAFVLHLARFFATWPMSEPSRDVEALVEDAAQRAGFTPVFLPPAALGLVKYQRPPLT